MQRHLLFLAAHTFLHSKCTCVEGGEEWVQTVHYFGAWVSHCNCMLELPLLLEVPFDAFITVLDVSVKKNASSSSVKLMHNIQLKGKEIFSNHF